MTLLPPELARLAELCTKKDSTRWAVTGVSLEVNPDGSYTATGTDCQVLVTVSGAARAGEVPGPLKPAVEAAPNGSTGAIIPAGLWRQAFAGAGSAGAVAAVLSESTCTLVGFGKGGAVAHGPPVIGRFPPVEQIVPPPTAAVARVAIDPAKLLQVLKVVAALAGEDGRADVEVHNQYVVIRGVGPAGSFVGMAMGLADQVPTPAARAGEPAPVQTRPPAGARARLVALLDDAEKLSVAISPEARKAAGGADRALAKAAGCSKGFVHKLLKLRGQRVVERKLVPVPPARAATASS